MKHFSSLLLLLTGVVFLFSGCAQPEPPSPSVSLSTEADSVEAHDSTLVAGSDSFLPNQAMIDGTLYQLTPADPADMTAIAASPQQNYFGRMHYVSHAPRQDMTTTAEFSPSVSDGASVSVYKSLWDGAEYYLFKDQDTVLGAFTYALYQSSGQGTYQDGRWECEDQIRIDGTVYQLTAVTPQEAAAVRELSAQEPLDDAVIVFGFPSQDGITSVMMGESGQRLSVVRISQQEETFFILTNESTGEQGVYRSEAL